eukprot:7883850-Pyramimonas_sp.AAC.1
MDLFMTTQPVAGAVVDLQLREVARLDGAPTNYERSTMADFRSATVISVVVWTMMSLCVADL